MIIKLKNLSSDFHFTILQLFLPLHHDDMVSKLCLDRRIGVYRIAHGGHWEGKCSILEWSHHGSSSLPTQGPSLPCLVFTKCCGNITEPLTSLQLGHGLHALALLLTQDVPHIDSTASTSLLLGSSSFCSFLVPLSTLSSTLGISTFSPSLSFTIFPHSLVEVNQASVSL